MNGAQDVVGYWLRAGNVIAPDANLNDVSLYQYPAGGDPALSIRKPRPALRRRRQRRPFEFGGSGARQGTEAAALPAYVAPRRPKARGWFSHDAAGQRLVYITAWRPGADLPREAQQAAGRADHRRDRTPPTASASIATAISTSPTNMTITSSRSARRDRTIAELLARSSMPLYPAVRQSRQSLGHQRR